MSTMKWWVRANSNDASEIGFGTSSVTSPGADWIEAPAMCDSRTHWIDQGTIVAYTETQAAAKANRPEFPATWSNTTMSWVDTRTLEQTKADRWEVIKAARAAHIDAGLVTPYGQFQTAPLERQNITDAVLLAQTLTAMGQPVAIDWTLADNTVVTLGLPEIVTVGLLLGQRVQEAHAHARTLRAAIDAATTVAEIEAITWD